MLRIGVVVAMLAIGGVPATAQDIAQGEKAFAKCRACHQVGETAKNQVGPVLNGLFGRSAGTIPGFKYSEANQKSGIVWDQTSFATYIKDPRAAMPGNKMAFPGIKNDAEIANLIAFLQQFDAEGKKSK
jgi:cytochrome c